MPLLRSSLLSSAFLTRVAGIGLAIAGQGAWGCASSPKPAPATAGKVSSDVNARDEVAVMETLRREAKDKASAAVVLSQAQEAEQRFGDTPAAEERRALAIDALIDLGKVGEARSRAYDFLNRYPNGPHSARVAGRTGVHVTPPMGPSK